MYAITDRPDLSGGNQDGWIEMEKVSQKYIMVFNRGNGHQKPSYTQSLPHENHDGWIHLH